MKTTKYITCVIIHCLFLWYSISVYNIHLENKMVIENSKPIRVYIKNIKYHAKSSDTADIIFNNKEYKHIIFCGNDINKSTYNHNAFYYDKKKDRIFCECNYKSSGIFTFVLFILSFLLWLLPKEKFSLKW